MKLLPLSPQQVKEKLEWYLERDELFRKTFNFTKKRFNASKKLTAHNWEHALRDTCNAIYIGEKEGADMTIVLPATIMHDIGFLFGATGATHGEVGARSLPLFLLRGRIGYSRDEQKKIAECIRTHKGSMHGEKPKTLEAKVVSDADFLEKFGLFGVYQYIRTFGEFNRPIEEVLRRAKQMNEFKLQTKTAKDIATKETRQLVTDFMNELGEAQEPYSLVD